MDKKLEPMKLVFTSYRDSLSMDGLKVSLDRHAPKLCSYSALNYLIMPTTRNLTMDNMERICVVVLNNNWNLIHDFINGVYALGLYQLTLCCWCTKEQIDHGKFCFAGIIGDYIQDKADRDGAFKFPLEISYGDGRDTL